MSDKDDADQLYIEAHRVRNQFCQYVFSSAISFSYKYYSSLGILR